MKKLTDYAWEGSKFSFENDNYCRLFCKDVDGLADIFPDDSLLAGEDNMYDNYLHVYYDVDNNVIEVLEVGYELCTWEGDVMLDISEEEKAYFTSILQKLWDKQPDGAGIEPVVIEERKILEALVGQRFTDAKALEAKLNELGYEHAVVTEPYEPDMAEGDYIIDATFDKYYDRAAFTVFCLKTRQGGIYITETAAC